jgi:hypothetical protein
MRIKSDIVSISQAGNTGSITKQEVRKPTEKIVNKNGV